MKCTTVYDLCRVIVEQADTLERALNRFDSALETLDNNEIRIAHRNMDIILTVMMALADEATNALADDPDIYKDDDETWGDY